MVLLLNIKDEFTVLQTLTTPRKQTASAPPITYSRMRRIDGSDICASMRKSLCITMPPRRPGDVSTRFDSGIQILLRLSSRSIENRKSAMPTIFCSFCTFLTSVIPHQKTTFNWVDPEEFSNWCGINHLSRCCVVRLLTFVLAIILQHSTVGDHNV